MFCQVTLDNQPFFAHRLGVGRVLNFPRDLSTAAMNLSGSAISMTPFPSTASALSFLSPMTQPTPDPPATLPPLLRMPIL